jgi:hypothetical protein
MAWAQRTGVLHEFNQEYRRQLLEAQARGERNAPGLVRQPQGRPRRGVRRAMLAYMNDTSPPLKPAREPSESFRELSGRRVAGCARRSSATCRRASSPACSAIGSRTRHNPEAALR